ncbi:VPS10 domain-containing protein [Candidatus Palauibacter sp.]|uniref:VPS10 domain-containing protein n=1 Tax=Candidatus Palauibacter sp. TaxID=3101350 RepID=UPI003B5B4B0D
MRVRSFSIRPLIAGFALLLAAFPAVTPLAAQAAPDPAAYETLRWRNIGPEGNRFSAAAGIPGQPYTYYVGAASGGIYKTTDGGVNWDEMFDDQPVQSIGSLAVSPTDPNIVWTGTGEGKIRSHVSIGQGVYKSTDAGETWTLMGLEPTGRIPRLVIHPTNPDIVYVCALGHSYGPQPERGVYRTMDGGESWEHVLFIDEDTGCSDIAMDPTNPRVLFAGTWQLEIHTWGRTSGGPGGGLHVSRDGGDTWEKLNGPDNTIGLPKKPVGKVAVAIAASNTQRVYAMLETGDGIPWDGQPTEDGQLWRSEDGGRTWALITRNRNAMGRPHYYSRVVISPDDEDEAYFLTASFTVSTDGGRTLDVIPRAQAPGGDHHDMWIDPTNPDRMIVAHDQGLSISINRTKTWFRQRLTNAQMYHVTVDNAVPYNVLGNKQDEPTYRGPSNSRILGVRRINHIPRGMWHHVGGGESGFATPDPTDPNVVWSSASGSGMVGGIVVRYEEERRQYRPVEVWPEQSRGPASGVRYRFIWDAPVHISPHDNETVYVGSQHVHRTRNRGQSWEVISPDLTLNDRSRMGLSGGLTGDNIGVEYAGTVFGIAESPIEAGLIWAGTNDGKLHITRDGGENWTDVTGNVAGLPEWIAVRSIAPSRYDAGTAYIAADGHQVNIRDPHVYRTRDFGASWEKITDGIPPSMLSYTKIIVEDPVRPGMLYVGTENAIYVSFNDGDDWQPLQNNLPAAPVSGIVVQEHFNDLVVGTYGRGFWIFDDLSPIQQMTPEVMASASHLFAPRDAYRFRPITPPSIPYDDPTIGEDPQYGASLNYWLAAEASEAPTIEILDGSGTVVRTLEGPNRAGVSRIHWDLRDEPNEPIRMLTPPRYAEHIEVGDEGRPAPGGQQISILMPPGQYTVRLSVDGATHEQPLTVLKDPHSAGTEAEIAEQLAFIREVREDVVRAGDAVHRVEAMRVQLRTLARFAEDDDLSASVEDVRQKLVDLQETMVDLRLTGQGQDGVRFEARLLQKLGYLVGALSIADFRPTDQEMEVKVILHDALEAHLAELEELVRTDVAALNETLRGLGMLIITDDAF